MQVDARSSGYLKESETIFHLRMVEGDGNEREDLVGVDILSKLLKVMGTKHLVANAKRKCAMKSAFSTRVCLNVDFCRHDYVALVFFMF